MNINKNNLLVAKAASTDDTRCALQTIYFDTDGTVATDGHKLVKVGYPSQVDHDSLPVVLPKGDIKNIKPFLIPSSCVPALAKIQPKVKNLPVLENIFLDVDRTNANGSAHFSATDLTSISNPEIKKVDAQFPDYKKVFPIPQEESGEMKDTGKEPLLEIVFNPELLRDTCDIAVKMGLVGCKFNFFGANHPALITGTNSDDQEFTALVMPKRL